MEKSGRNEDKKKERTLLKTGRIYDRMKEIKKRERREGGQKAD
jgi:hypothetical protein